MINYQIFNNTILIIYDGLRDRMYTISNFQWDCRDYYHFWLIDEQPVRTYDDDDLRDNRNKIVENNYEQSIN